jgi:hypothetical protein
MATGGLYGNSGTGALIAESGAETPGLYGKSPNGSAVASTGSETSGLYGNTVNFGGTYFEWFIFQQASTQPATPTGGTWNFVTNIGTAPSGWTQSPPTAPTNEIWVSIAFVNSKDPSNITWSAPGLLGVIASTNVGTTTTGAAGSSASVTNSGTPLNAVLDFTIPQGATGATGATGTAATIAVGTTTTLNPGVSATVTNSGSSSAAVFNFGIPKGAGVNAGGTTGQVLTKASGTDYDTAWTTITGTLNYQGAWNASTNSPTLTSSVGTNGYYYVVNVAGSTNLNGVTDWQIGDWAIFNGSIWQKLDQTNLVTSVAGRTGAVVLANTDISGLGTMSTQNANFVAITGGTESGVTHSGDIIGTYLDHTGTTAPAYTEGRTWYDSTSHALSYYNDVSSAIVHIGQDLQLKVINNTGSTIANGSPVYVTSTSSGQTYPNIALAKADVASTASVIGLTNGSIANGAVGYVTAQGGIDNVNTGSFTVGQVLYLSPYSAGQLMNTIPPTGITVQVGVVSYVNSSAGKIYVKQTTPLSVPASIISGQIALANGGTSANLTATAGGVVYSGASAMAISAAGTSGQVLTSSGAGAPTWTTPTTGAVTSVTATSPVVSSGGANPNINLDIAYGDTLNPYGSKTANYVLAAPNGSSGVPTFRAIAASDIPTLNQNTTGTAANITATSNSTLTTLSALSLPYSQLSGTVPTWNQNTTGTAANVTGTVAIANGGTGATSAAAALTSLGAYPASNPNGYTSNAGTVTSVSGTGTVSGLTLSGTVTGTGNLTLGGAITGFAASGANTDITSIALTSGTISTSPSSSNDIVNKSYADSIATGVNFHAACNYATTAALSPTNTYNNGASGVGATLIGLTSGTLTIDGYTLVSGDVGKRILVKNEANGAYNGVYTVTTVGTGSVAYVLTRATDYDTSGSGTNEIDQGDLFLVLNGSTNANTSWVQQTPLPVTVGTTSLTFLQFAAVQTYTAGTGLSLATNQFSITNVGTAGTYGAAATVPVITTNAQGQVTSVTNTSIAIAGSAVTGNITGNAANVTGTVALTNGGSGQTSAQAAINAFAGAVTSGSYLRGNGTNVVMATIQAADVPTLNQNTTGNAATATLATTATTANALNTGNSYTVTAISDAAGNLRSLPLNSQTAAYIVAASDNGKVISITTGGVTVNNSIMSAGMVVTVYNNSASSQTITQGTGVTLQWAGQSASTTGNRTLGLYGMATILFLSASSAVITGSGLT